MQQKDDGRYQEAWEKIKEDILQTGKSHGEVVQRFINSLCVLAELGQAKLMDAMLEDKDVRMAISPGSRNMEGKYAIHYACYGGSVEALRCLEKHGASMGIDDMGGNNALHYATQGNQTEVLKYLLEHPLATTFFGKDVANSQNQNYWTPLHVAAQYNCPEAAETLIHYGASLRHENSWGRTPVDVAKEMGHGEILAVFKNTAQYRVLDNTKDKGKEKEGSPRKKLSTSQERVVRKQRKDDKGWQMD